MMDIVYLVLLQFSAREENMKRIVAIILVLVLGLSLCACKSNSGTQPGNDALAKWPEQPIEIIVPAAAGGDTDIYARLFAKYMEQDFGVSVTVANVTGGSGSIGLAQAHDAEADGYTMVFWVASSYILCSVMDLVDYDYTDMEMIGMPLTDGSNMLIASSKFKDKTLADVINDLKANPKCYTFGTMVGNLPLLAALGLEEDAGVQFTQVDAGAMSPRIKALLSGDIDFIFAPYASVKDYLTTGEMVALGVFANDRLDILPDVPTVISYGYQDSIFDKGFFAAMPKGTDTGIVKKVADEMKKICGMKEFADDIAVYNLVPDWKDATECLNYFETTSASFSKFEKYLK